MKSLIQILTLAAVLVSLMSIPAQAVEPRPCVLSCYWKCTSETACLVAGQLTTCGEQGYSCGGRWTSSTPSLLDESAPMEGCESMAWESVDSTVVDEETVDSEPEEFAAAEPLTLVDPPAETRMAPPLAHETVLDRAGE